MKKSELTQERLVLQKGLYYGINTRNEIFAINPKTGMKFLIWNKTNLIPDELTQRDFLRAEISKFNINIESFSEEDEDQERVKLREKIRKDKVIEDI